MGYLAKKFLSTFYKPIVKWYLQKPRSYFYQGIKVIVNPGVFHPGLFYSTKLLLKQIEGVNLFQKKILELGCGSGLISCVLASKGAMVTATDISPLAISNTIENVQRNKLSIDVIQSDLFSSITHLEFDFILINPPYFKGQPTSDERYAWYAGPNLEYFQKLFFQLKANLKQSQCIMILSDDCDLMYISEQAKLNNLKLRLLNTHRLLTEENYTYAIELQ